MEKLTVKSVSKSEPPYEIPKIVLLDVSLANEKMKSLLTREKRYEREFQSMIPNPMMRKSSTYSPHLGSGARKRDVIWFVP